MKQELKSSEIKWSKMINWNSMIKIDVFRGPWYTAGNQCFTEMWIISVRYIAISDTLLNKHQEDEWGVEWINEQTSSEQQKLCFTHQTRCKVEMQIDMNLTSFSLYIEIRKQKDNITPIPQSHCEA